MAAFAALLARDSGDWSVEEVSLDDCTTLGDVVDLLRDVDGEVRLVVIEQDDEYAAIVRADDPDEEPRAFLSDGHSADAYPVAALVAEDLSEIGGDDLDGDEDAPPAHDSAPFGEADIVDDLGTSADQLLALCAHEGTLPVDVLVAVCQNAGCGDEFEELRG